MGLFGKKNKKSSSAQESGLTEDIQSEKAKSDIILHAIDDGVILIDANRNVLSINKAAVSLTGWQAQEATGLNYTQVLPLVNDRGEAYLPKLHPLERIFTEIATIRDDQGSLKSRSGKMIPVSLSVSPLTNHKSEIIGAVAVFRDFTIERGREKQQAEFISTASHEMRTPVAAIEGYLSLAMNGNVCKIDAKARDFLEKAHSSSQHLGQLFQDLLTSSKAEDGRLSNHPVVVEVGELVQNVAEEGKFNAQKKNLGVEFVLGSQDQAVNAGTINSGLKVVKPLYYSLIDPERIHEVLTNLFDNAVKYTEAGKVTFGITGNDQVVQIRISDTGGGISAEDMPHLFEKFYRIDNTMTRTIGGTGLGLFICQKIVELYQGRIWVESTLGKGSTFFINLPRLSSKEAGDIKANEVLHGASPLAPAGSQTVI